MSAELILVAMSGGVDSSVAAALLKAQGHDVRGVTCELFPGQTDTISRAQKVARFLGIPHEVLDLKTLFKQHVIAPFCQTYHAGYTPNPCVNCNHHIKFGALLEHARTQGAARLATGHYARIAPKGGPRLLKAVDQSKDQSYFLYTLSLSQLSAALLPLGEMTKTEVKQMAGHLGLNDLIRQGESQDLCFIPNGDYAAFVTKCHKPVPGEIVDAEGRTLGKHRGLVYYTVGQRKGLGIASASPLYVIRLDTSRNQVVIGPQEMLQRTELTAQDLHWIASKPPADLSGITARVRYKSPEAPVSIIISQDVLHASFLVPQWAVAPGQSIVFYRGDEVLGGGIIV